MRITIFLCLISIIQVFALPSLGQVKLDLKMTNTTIEELLQKMEENTNFRFFYQSEVLKNKQRINIEFEQKSVRSILDEVLPPLQLKYEVFDNYIAIKSDDGGFSNQESDQEQKSVSGKVTDSSGSPLPGVTVVVKGTTQGTVTDAGGEYSLSTIPEDATLQFSFVGMRTLEVVVEGQTVIDITLEENAIGIEEVVAVGYGYQSKKKVTSSISEVNMEGIKEVPLTNSGQVLQGRVSGITVNDNNGSPGASPSLKVRGISSINAGIEPLIIIDGVPVGNGMPTSLNPADIQKITVLKDAASTSIYGARGSNGVVLIETMKATESTSQIEFNSSVGIQALPQAWRTPVLDAQEYAQYNKEYIEDLNAKNGTSTAIPQIYLDVLANPDFVSTDWQDEVFKEAIIQSYNLTLRAGNEKIRGAVNGGYLEQEGILPSTDFKRYSLRSNTDVTINEWIKFGSSLSASYTERNQAPSDGQRGILMRAVTASPLQSPYDKNGELRPYISADSEGYFSYTNPLFEAKEVSNTATTRDINASINLDITILPGLHFKPQLYSRLYNSETNNFTPTTIGQFAIGNAGNLSPGAPPYVNSASNSKYDILNWGIDNLLTFNKMFKNHSFSLLAGYTAQKQSGKYSQITGKDFPTDNNINYLEASEVNANIDDYTNWSLAAMFFRVSYDYKSRYMLEINFRREGSSKFGKDNKYGNFPSASVGWRISQEDFFPQNTPLSELKLRASYGVTGNSAIGDFDGFGRVLSIPNLNNLSDNYNYVLGNNIVTGKALTSLGASDLKWETSTQLDIGVNLGLFNDKLTVNASYFHKRTEDMLFNLSLPRATGFSSTRANVGEMLNTGWDFEVSYSADFNNLRWNSSLNVSTLKNNVEYIPEQIGKIISTYNVTQVGSPVGSLYGWVIEGIFNTQEQLDDPNLAGWPGAKQLGAYIYKDIDGDGTITGNDRDVIGNPHPKVTFGFNNTFNYKNFSLSVLATGALGYQILPQMKEVIYNEKVRWNVSTDFLERWRSPENPGVGIIPAGYYPGQHKTSNLWIEDGDHLWIKNVTLAYSLPKSLLNKVDFISSTKFYVSVQNVAKITGYSGWNPQISSYGGSNPQSMGVDNYSYPVNRTVTLGVNLIF
ncbi:SusC/RagA family TonB-linked outer membrane protein [Maribellus maritimus]|uniref:SusC/RagA family TonB-linked outer membrane protein n=1 Tax=Maribellus maritimus TaxID=2870838 RepID=UPI001EEA6CFA|nr:TonB-dependent receptor [Maribellus maritimus]MCG6190654.1 TonB-dependent receptor [Maribellus maritimus]